MKNLEKKSNSTSIHLCESQIQSFTDLVNLFFEYCVMFRWMFFKNRPRGNYLLVRSFLVVGLWAVLYYKFFSSFRLLIQGVDVHPVIAFVFAITIGYWNMTNVFHRKSAYCSNLHNEYLKEKGHGNDYAVRLLGNNLSIQLLALDLWAHRSFTNVLRRNLYAAIEFTSGDAKGEVIEKLETGKMSVRDARLILQTHQEHLLAEGK